MSIPESAYNADAQIVYSAPVHKGCPASWVPKEGGPGYQCALPAGHDGLHDSTPPSVAESNATDEPVCWSYGCTRYPGVKSEAYGGSCGCVDINTHQSTIPGLTYAISYSKLSVWNYGSRYLSLMGTKYQTSAMFAQQREASQRF